MPPVTSAAGTAAGIPPRREDVAAAADVATAPDKDMVGMPPHTPRGAADAAGARADENAGRTPSPRKGIQDAPAAAVPDEDMGRIPPPRGAADAAGVAAGIPQPREDVAAADGSGAAPGEDAVAGHGREEVTAPPPPGWNLPLESLATVPESAMCRVRRDARRGDDLVGVGGVVVAGV